MENDINRLKILLERFDELKRDLNITMFNLQDNIVCGKYVGEEELDVSKNCCNSIINDLRTMIAVNKSSSGDNNG